MKYLCARCERLVHPARVEVHDACIEIVCPKCGAREQVAVQQQHPSEPVTALPPSPYRDEQSTEGPHGLCPKCSTPRGAGRSCPRCGLVYERWRPTEADEPPPTLVALWTRVQEDWDDDARHDEFMRAAFESNALAYAARRYRSRDDETSEKQLEKLTLLGVQAMRGAEAPASLTPRIGRTIGWAVFALLCLVLASLAFFATR